MISPSSSSTSPDPISTFFARFDKAPPLPDQPRTRGGTVRYERILLLAWGGMASVFLATQWHGTTFDRFVAVKQAHPRVEPRGVQSHRMHVEGALSGAIHHPNVVRTLDLVDAEGQPRLVLEYVEGPSLREVFAEGSIASPVPLSIVVSIVLDLLKGLHAVHELKGRDGARLGLVHGDVSPGNVLLGIDGRARLADFGLATTHAARQSRARRVEGTPGYLSPEQACGEHFDLRSDLFAAGILLFELTTGQRLYRGASRSEIVRHAKQGPRRAPVVLEVAALPRSLREICRRALAPRREDRYASALAFSRDLERAATATVGIASHDVAGRWVVARFGARIRRQRQRIAEWSAGLPAEPARRRGQASEARTS